MALHPLYILVDVCSIDNEEEVVFSHLVNQEVVNGATVLVAHHAVENLARLSSTYVVGEDMAHVALCVRTLNRYFAHVRHVEHATMLAYSVVLVSNVRILDRHDESAKRLHQGSESHVFVIETCFLFHISSV